MHRALMLILSIAVLTLSAWAQDGEESATAETESSVAATEAEAGAETEITREDETAEEPVVDDVYYQDVDDKDFRPSEDIPADQSIPFPTDI